MLAIFVNGSTWLRLGGCRSVVVFGGVSGSYPAPSRAECKRDWDMREDVLRYLPTATIGSGIIFDAVRAHRQAHDDAKRYPRGAAKLLKRIMKVAAAGERARATYLRGQYCDALRDGF
jgi:hypothetical protein